MRTMLSTFDNPFNPFDDFDKWFRYDTDHGYNSCQYLARIARTSDAFSDKEFDDEIERAIDEIIKYDFTNMYRKVKEGETIKPINFEDDFVESNP